MNTTPSGPDPEGSKPVFSVNPLPPGPVPDPTPETPWGPAVPVHLPDHPEYQPPPVSTMPSLVDDLAARPLFRLRTWLSIFFGALAWVAANFFGVADVNVATWAGSDQILTLGELIVGAYTAAAAYFTARRKAGPVAGIVAVPNPADQG